MSLYPWSHFEVSQDDDIDLDFATMDTFGELDFDMDSYDPIDSGSDPFSDLSLEESLDLVNEISNICDTSNEESKSDFMLEDFDMKDPLRKDCMWSSMNHSGKLIKHQVKIENQALPSHSFGQLSLTPPTSYIKAQLKNNFPALPTHETESYSHHQNTSCFKIITPKEIQANNIITPPESSEDEDSGFSYNHQNPRNMDMKSFDGNKDQQNIINHKLKKSRDKSSHKIKFKFSITVGSNNKIKPRYKPSTNNFNTNVPREKNNDSQLLLHNYHSIKSVDQNEGNNMATHFPQIDKKQKSLKSNKQDTKVLHNLMERQRRNDLKIAFDTLRNHMPTLAKSERASKQVVLDKAIDFCNDLKRREIQKRKEKQMVAHKNEELNRKLAYLQSEISALQLENVSWKLV